MINKGIYDILKQWLEEAVPDWNRGDMAVKQISNGDGTYNLEINTDCPGALIGKAGTTFDKYVHMLQELTITPVVEVKINEMNGFVHKPKTQFLNRPDRPIVVNKVRRDKK